MADPNVYGESDPPQRSQGGSVWPWILGIAAVALVVCCGGVGFGVWKLKQLVQDAATEDPVKIRAQTAEMVDIEIPEKYEPKMGMNMGIMRMAIYQTDPTKDDAGDMLMLMEMTMQKFGVDNQQQEQELRKSMNQQTQAQRGNQNFKSSKSETREIEIRGEKVPFEFTEGIMGEPGQEKTVHMVSGVFQGKSGPVMLQLIEPDENYDEEAVVKMLESIE